MPVLLQTPLLLICSNVFVPFAVLHMKQPLKLNYLVCERRLKSAARGGRKVQRWAWVESTPG